MKYSRVYIDAIGYELPPVVVTSRRAGGAAQARLRGAAHPRGAARSAHRDRRAALVGAGLPALATGRSPRRGTRWRPSNVRADDLDVLIYAGVCRELFEPATACRVAAELGVGPDAAVYDVSNACLGVLNGMVDIANRIELGQIRAGWSSRARRPARSTTS